MPPHQQRWLRIIPVALVMYMISYIDRTNVSLALDPNLSTMMRDLAMDDRMKGQAAGIFFFGYLLLQIPAGWLASRWSARNLIALFLFAWGICAAGCGLVQSFVQFQAVRFLLGVAESGVFPATLVLLTHWFPRQERARANAYWNLCVPLSVAISAPLTGWLIGLYGWQTMLMIEGALPFLWLPVWLCCIRDHPHQARWLDPRERESVEALLAREAAELPPSSAGGWRVLLTPSLYVMVAVYFLLNCAVYGLMTFLSEALRNRATQTGFEYGILFAVPYAVAGVLMILVSRHSDRTGERRVHVALAFAIGGACLVASVLARPYSFWLSYLFLCFAVPAPFVVMPPFWAIPAETLPRSTVGAIMGLVNAVGNLGGFLGPFIVGILKKETQTTAVPFAVLGAGLIVAGVLSLRLPKSSR
jgi:MFS family permease